MKNNYFIMKKSAYSLISLAFIITFCNCSSKQPDVNLSVYRALSLSLKQSNYEIESQIKNLQKAMERDIPEPQSAYHAKEWLPKILLIQSISNQLFQYLDSQKINLKIEAGIKLVNNVEYWEENDYKAVANLFEKKGIGEELKKRIHEYEMKVLAIDPKINSVFKKSIYQVVVLHDNHLNTQKTFTEIFFSNIPAIGALAVLQKFENDIRNLEIQVITYCYLQVPG